MDYSEKDLKDFRLFQKTGIVPNSIPTKKPENITVWQLSHIKTGVRLIHGNYALCRSKMNKLNLKDKKEYKIVPFKK